MCAASNSFGTDGLNLPYSLEAEQSVLGAILLDSSCLSRVRSVLRKPEYFHLAQHRAIYAQMCALEDFQKPVDFVTVLEALTAAQVYDDAAGKTYLTQLAQMVPSIVNVMTYAEIVRNKYDVRTLILASREIIDTATDGQTPADVLLDSAEQKIYDIRQGRDTGELRHIGNVIVEAYDRLQKLSTDTTGEFAPLSTGLSGVDAVLTGFNKSDLLILGARPGMGKTSFALTLAYNVGVRQKKTVAFFSLEMSCMQLVMRMLSSEAQIPGPQLTSGRLSPEEWKSFSMAASMLHNAPIYFDDTSSITVPEIKAKLRRMKQVDLVMIDYLGLMTTGRRTENRVQEVSEITRTLKVMAKDLDVPVLLLAQLSRGSEHRAEHRPQLADLRDSGSIEQDADVVMFLYRSTYYKDGEDGGQSENPTAAELIIAKNRHGAVETVPLHWEGQFTRFTTQEYIRPNG